MSHCYHIVINTERVNQVHLVALLKAFVGTKDRPIDKFILAFEVSPSGKPHFHCSLHTENPVTSFKRTMKAYMKEHYRITIGEQKTDNMHVYTVKDDDIICVYNYSDSEVAAWRKASYKKPNRKSRDFFSTLVETAKSSDKPLNTDELILEFVIDEYVNHCKLLPSVDNLRRYANTLFLILHKIPKSKLSKDAYERRRGDLVAACLLTSI